MVGHSHTVPVGAKCGNGLQYLGAVVGWGSTINMIVVADLAKGGSTPPVVLEDIYWSMCNALIGYNDKVASMPHMDGAYNTVIMDTS